MNHIDTSYTDQLAQEGRSLWSGTFLAVLRNPNPVPLGNALEVADSALEAYNRRFQPRRGNGLMQLTPQKSFSQPGLDGLLCGASLPGNQQVGGPKHG